MALPDRSCGLASSRRVGAALESVREMVHRVHAGATTPMLTVLREPAELLARAV